MKNQESMPKNKINFKKFLFIGTFVFIFAVCLGFAQVISSFIIPSSTQVSQNLATPAFKLFFLSLNKSQLENSAKTLACDYQALGAGGYAWKQDNYYHVISSAYEKENDATLVQNNIKQTFNLDSQIFSVDFPSLAFSGEYENESKKVLAKSLKAFYTTYTQLFDIAISLDTNVYNDISSRLALNSVYTNFNSTYSDFKTMFDSSQEPLLQKLNDCQKQGVEILEKLCSGKLIDKNQTFSSLIKYRYLEFLSNYYSFLNSI